MADSFLEQFKLDTGSNFEQLPEDEKNRYLKENKVTGFRSTVSCKGNHAILKNGVPSTGEGEVSFTCPPPEDCKDDFSFYSLEASQNSTTPNGFLVNPGTSTAKGIK